MTMTVPEPRLYATLISPVMPECIKVLSPMTATVFPAASGPRTLVKPWAMPMDAPMHREVSMAVRGDMDAQSIAADVAGDGELQFFQHV